MNQDSFRFWKQIGSLGFHMVPVILGVFLAMWLSDLQSGSADRRFVNRLLDAIAVENAANATQIKGLLDKQLGTMDSLRYYAKVDTVSIMSVISKVKGLSSPDLNQTSLSLLQASHMTLIDFETLEKLGKIGLMHNNYSYNQKLLGSFFYENSLSTANEAKLTLSYILADLVEYEREILVHYEELSQMLPPVD